MRREVNQQEQELERLKRKLELRQNEEFAVEDDVFRKTSNITSSKTEMEQITEECAFEMMKQHQYRYMINRIQRDPIATKIKANELHESYASKQAILEEETEKNRKAK